MNRLLLLIVFCCFAADAVADEPSRRGRGEPPQVAVDACSGQAQGASCQFEGRRGEALDGTCRTVPSEQLACVPQGHRPPRDRDRDESEAADFS